MSRNPEASAGLASRPRLWNEAAAAGGAAPSVFHLCWPLALTPNSSSVWAETPWRGTFFSCVPCFVSTLRAISSPQASSSPSHAFSFHSPAADLHAPVIFSLFHSFVRPVAFPQLPSPHYSCGFFPLPSCHPSSLLPLLIQSRPRHCACLKFPLCPPPSAPQCPALPQAPSAGVPLACLTLFFKNQSLWEIGDGEITLPRDGRSGGRVWKPNVSH